MKLRNRNKKGNIYYSTDTHFKVAKAAKRIIKELTKAGYSHYIVKSSKSNTIYLIMNDTAVVRISNHTERCRDANKYSVISCKQDQCGDDILERVNILSNEGMFEFIDYLRKYKLN